MEAARRNRATRAGLDPPLISGLSAPVPPPARLAAVGWWPGVVTGNGGAAPRGPSGGGKVHWATGDRTGAPHHLDPPSAVASPGQANHLARSAERQLPGRAPPQQIRCPWNPHDGGEQL